MTKKTRKKANKRKPGKKRKEIYTLRLPIILTVLLVFLSIFRIVLPIFGKDITYSILDNEEAVLGVQNLSTEWDFSDPSEYKLYDDTSTQISAGIINLIQFDQEDFDNTPNGFGSGTHSDTEWDAGNEWVKLTSAGQTNGSGEFTSRTMDAGSSTNWDTISWVPQRPNYKELPNYGQIETGYNSGNANMTGSILLAHLNELSGTIADSSGQGNHGNYNGALYSQTGKLGNAIGFDGIDNYINCGNAGDGNYTSLTISTWFRASSFSPSRWRTTLHRNDGTSVGSSVFFIGLVSGSNQIISTIGSGSGAPGGYMAGATGITAQIGAWYHVVNSWDGTTARIYVNGVEVNTYSMTSASFSNKTANTKIGSSGYGDGYLFNGDIDEVAIWDRNLSPTEILDNYKRGALRLKLQVRSGDSTPLTGDFVGPNGTTGDYYSELSNTTPGTPSLNLTNVSDNQYFQYKTYFETDNSSYTPELKTVTIGPTHYSSSNPAISNNTGAAYSKLTSFTEVLGTGNQGSVGYQISNNNTDWYYWTGLKWEKETGSGHPSQTNTASEISANVATFHESVGTGSFYFKAFLASDSTQQVEIDSIKLDYSTGSSDTQDDDDDDTPTGTYTPNASQDGDDDDDDDDDIDTTPQTGEEQKFDIYMAIVDEDKYTIQLKGHAFDEIWIVAKVMGNTITAISADTKKWTMNISIKNMQKYLKPGENTIEINAYDQNRNLLESKELILLKKVEYKLNNYQTIMKTLDSAILSIGFIDITSGSILLIRKYSKTSKSSKQSPRKL